MNTDTDTDRRRIIATLRTALEHYHYPCENADQETRPYCPVCQVIRAANDFAGHGHTHHDYPGELDTYLKQAIQGDR